MPVPGGGDGLGVLDELAVGGVVPGPGDQHGRARGDAERGGGVVAGGRSGVFFEGAGGAGAGGLGDVGQGPGGQGLGLGEARRSGRR